MSLSPRRRAVVAVVDPGSGNLASVLRALERASELAGIPPVEAAVTHEPAAVARADRIVLPGQGAFAACMNGLRALPGMDQYPAEKTLDPSEVARIIGRCVTGDLRYTSGEVIYVHKTMA